MKRMIMLGIMLAVQSFCCDFADQRCDTKTYTEYPTFSNNGSRFEKGKLVCSDFGSKTFAFDTMTVKGVDVEVRLPKSVCRNIVEIIENEPAESTVDCCARKTGYSYNDDLHKCLSGLTYPECKTKPKYTVKYGSEIMFFFNFSKKDELKIIKNDVQFTMYDTLEVYRKTGALKFKGHYNMNGGDLTVRGYCYDKAGLNKVRMVNTVSACN